MIIVRSPLRISLGGGGTDLPSYYQDYSGFLIAAAIDKYVYISVQRRFVDRFLIKYSHLEEVETLEEIQHPIIRETMKFLDIQERNLEINSMADIPAGTGLGSSGSFTTALLMALHTYKRTLISPQELAEQACHIEMDILKEPIGKQDQYIASYGGLTCFDFKRDGTVIAQPLRIPEEALFNLEDNLLLFFTGYSRSASEILRDQDIKSREGDPKMITNLNYTKEIGWQSKYALEVGALEEFGELMNKQWLYKNHRSRGISNPRINELVNFAINHGALGGKLVGAGGGGCLLFYTQDKMRLRRAMREKGLREVRFRFDFEGTKVLMGEIV